MKAINKPEKHIFILHRFNCCLTVVLSPEKWADHEKIAYVLYCHIKLAFLFNLSCVSIQFIRVGLLRVDSTNQVPLTTSKISCQPVGERTVAGDTQLTHISLWLFLNVAGDTQLTHISQWLFLTVAGDTQVTHV